MLYKKFLCELHSTPDLDFFLRSFLKAFFTCFIFNQLYIYVTHQCCCCCLTSTPVTINLLLLKSNHFNFVQNKELLLTENLNVAKCRQEPCAFRFLALCHRTLFMGHGSLIRGTRIDFFVRRNVKKPHSH